MMSSKPLSLHIKVVACACVPAGVLDINVLSRGRPILRMCCLSSLYEILPSKLSSICLMSSNTYSSVIRKPMHSRV
jgi:hypothetical protein